MGEYALITSRRELDHWLAGILAVCAVCLPLAAQTPATIDVDTTSTTPIHPNFSGVNDEAASPVEYFDYRFNALALGDGYGWVRFPGGNASDIYDWQTGEQVVDWIAQFAGNPPNGTQNSIAQVAGRGG